MVGQYWTNILGVKLLEEYIMQQNVIFYFRNWSRKILQYKLQDQLTLLKFPFDSNSNFIMSNIKGIET